MNWFKEFPRSEFLALIASGLTEDQAMDQVNLGRGSKEFGETVLVQYQVKDPTFREELEQAKKSRADVWFNQIAKGLSKDIEKDQVPAEKLKFDQRKYLAAIDNPEKYSEKVAHKLEIGINIFQEMKDLPANEVKKIIAGADPFAAEFVVLDGDEEESIEEKTPDSEIEEGMNAGFKRHVLNKWSDEESEEDILS